MIEELHIVCKKQLNLCDDCYKSVILKYLGIPGNIEVPNGKE